MYGKINLAQSYNYPQLVESTRSLRIAEVYGKINLAQSNNYPQLVESTRSLRILQKYLVRLT